MVQKMGWAMALVCLTATTAQAGLQSALTEALIGLQVTPVTITNSIVTLATLTPPPAIPEDALFIDPITSTRGAGVFREGPDFHYDSTTGSVTVFAPPMLGPADEFGVRYQYSPALIRVVGRDFFTEDPTIPQVTKYIRGTPEYSQYGLSPIPFDDNDPSFVLDEQSDSFSLHNSSEEIQISVRTRSELGGVEIAFASLLAPELEAGIFAADKLGILPNSIWPYLPQVDGALPEVHFVVDYNMSSYLSFYRSGVVETYSLLAVPQSGLLFGDGTSVPEPSSLLLAAFSLIVLLSSRQTSVAA